MYKYIKYNIMFGGCSDWSISFSTYQIKGYRGSGARPDMSLVSCFTQKLYQLLAEAKTKYTIISQCEIAG